MRLPSRLWLLLCGGLAAIGCVGGPISDWPPRNGPTEGSTDDDSAPPRGDDADEDTSGEGDDDDSTTPPPQNGGRADAGTRPSMRDAGTGSAMDAGAPAAEPPDTSTGDGGLSDGAVEPGSECTPTSDGRPQGACFGSYCRMAPHALAAGAQAGGACSDPAELALACDGEIARTVAACAQREALALGMGRAILGCARRTMALAEVDEGCLGCYVEEVVCSVRSCLAACLDGSPHACSACRAERCGERFLACSGLPAPEVPAPTIPADGGMAMSAACTPGADQSCNDDPAISSLHGRCNADGTCTCRGDYPLNPASGRCR